MCALRSSAVIDELCPKSAKKGVMRLIKFAVLRVYASENVCPVSAELLGNRKGNCAHQLLLELGSAVVGLLWLLPCCLAQKSGICPFPRGALLVAVLVQMAWADFITSWLCLWWALPCRPSAQPGRRCAACWSTGWAEGLCQGHRAVLCEHSEGGWHSGRRVSKSQQGVCILHAEEEREKRAVGIGGFAAVVSLCYK